MLKKICLAASLIVAGGHVFANTLLEMKTSMGNIEIELYDDKAPVSAKNFASYAKSNFYNGTIFHRVIPGFMEWANLSSSSDNVLNTLYMVL